MRFPAWKSIPPLQILILACAALGSAPGPAALPPPIPPGSRPPSLDFGVVYQGSVVEGSLTIAGTNMTGLGSRPPWVLVLDEEPWVPNHFGGSGYVVVRIDTSSPGDLSGVMVVETDAGDIPVQISASVRAGPATGVRVLVCPSPFSAGMTDDSSIFDPLRELMESAEADASYLVYPGPSELSRENLSSYDVVIISRECLRALDPGDLGDYVESGGTLAVFADHFWMGSVAEANRTLRQFGLGFRDEEIGFVVRAREIARSELTAGVNRLVMFRPSPVVVTSPGALIMARAAGEPPGEGLIGFAEVGSGRVLAVGNTLWWYSFLDPGEPCDNPRILTNLFEMAASGRGAGTGSSAGADFSVSVTPVELEVEQGGTAPLELDLMSVGGFGSEIRVTASSNPPAGISLEVPGGALSLPAGGSASASAILRVGGDIEPGSYEVTLNLSGGGVSHSVTLSVTVTAAPGGSPAAGNETGGGGGGGEVAGPGAGNATAGPGSGAPNQTGAQRAGNATGPPGGAGPGAGGWWMAALVASIVAVAAAAALVLRGRSRAGGGAGTGPVAAAGAPPGEEGRGGGERDELLRKLRERYESGEISEETYRELKKRLESG